jgi:hypothetical protein
MNIDIEKEQAPDTSIAHGAGSIDSISDDMGFTEVLGEYTGQAVKGNALSASMPLTVYIDNWHRASIARTADTGVLRGLVQGLHGIAADMDESSERTSLLELIPLFENEVLGLARTAAPSEPVRTVNFGADGPAQWSSAARPAVVSEGQAVAVAALSDEQILEISRKFWIPGAEPDATQREGLLESHRAVLAAARLAAPAPEAPSIPDEVFDQNTVYAALSPRAMSFVSMDAVSEVLDAVLRVVDVTPATEQAPAKESDAKGGA